MVTYHHGGRLGDAIYSLYTVKALGGGHVIITDFQKGNWGEEQARSLLPLLEYQDYIPTASFQHVTQPFFTSDTFYDLHDAELAHNPEAFPEWHGKSWPGNIHLAKRYAVHFGVEWTPGTTWLTAPKTKAADVVFHAPKRRTTDPINLRRVLGLLASDDFKVVVIGGPQDHDEWLDFGGEYICVQPKDMLEAADWINSAKVFLGAVSSGHAIAEALGKPRYVQMADGCDNVIPTAFINDWTVDQIYDTLLRHIKETP